METNISLPTVCKSATAQHSSVAEMAENVWGYAKRLRFIRRAIVDSFPNRHPPSIRALDVGCGNGSQVAIPLVSSGLQVTGIDPHLPSIERARQMTKNCGNARFVCGMVSDLGDGEEFDLIILSEVLEHVRHPRQVLQESLAHLADDGVVIVTVPNGYGEFEIDSWVFRTFGLAKLVDGLKNSRRFKGLVAKLRGQKPEVTLSTENQECGHVQFFTLSRLRELFTGVSLTVVHQKPATFLCGPLIAHTLGRAEGFVRWNARVTDKLPMMLASGWYFVLQQSCDRSKVYVPGVLDLEQPRVDSTTRSGDSAST